MPPKVSRPPPRSDRHVSGRAEAPVPPHAITVATGVPMGGTAASLKAVRGRGIKSARTGVEKSCKALKRRGYISAAVRKAAILSPRRGVAPAAKLPISPLAGEMAGRPEGGNVERVPRTIGEAGGTAPPSVGFADISPTRGEITRRRRRQVPLSVAASRRHLSPTSWGSGWAPVLHASSSSASEAERDPRIQARKTGRARRCRRCDSPLAREMACRPERGVVKDRGSAEGVPSATRSTPSSTSSSSRA